MFLTSSGKLCYVFEKLRHAQAIRELRPAQAVCLSSGKLRLYVRAQTSSDKLRLYVFDKLRQAQAVCF
jgi:hypothetical protein